MASPPRIGLGPWTALLSDGQPVRVDLVSFSRFEHTYGRKAVVALLRLASICKRLDLEPHRTAFRLAPSRSPPYQRLSETQHLYLATVTVTGQTRQNIDLYFYGRVLRVQSRKFTLHIKFAEYRNSRVKTAVKNTKLKAVVEVFRPIYV